MTESDRDPGTRQGAEDFGYLRGWTASALICLPYLDSGTVDERAAADRELSRRGYGAGQVRFVRQLAVPGLWWAIISWEWGHLDYLDILYGYGLHSVIAGVMLLIWSGGPFGFLRLPGVALIGVGVLLLAWSFLGWRMRNRSAQAIRIEDRV